MKDYSIKANTNILAFAALKGKCEVCKYIARICLSLINFQPDGEPHIILAVARSGDDVCFEALEKIVIGINGEEYMTQCLDEDGSNIFHMACASGNTLMCQYILNRYPNCLGLRKKDGSHALHLAAEACDVSCFDMILESAVTNGDKEQKDNFIYGCCSNYGDTVLHIVISF